MKLILGTLTALALLVPNAYGADTHGTYARGFLCDSQDQAEMEITIVSKKKLANLIFAQQLALPCTRVRYKYDAQNPVGDPVFILNIGYVQMMHVHVTALMQPTTWNVGQSQIVDLDWSATDLWRYIVVPVQWRPT